MGTEIERWGVLNISVEQFLEITITIKCPLREYTHYPSGFIAHRKEHSMSRRLGTGFCFYICAF